MLFKISAQEERKQTIPWVHRGTRQRDLHAMGFADITINKTSEAMKVSAKDAGSH